MSELSDEQREQEIRKQNARFASPDCQCAHCFLLRLLDADRVRADVAEAKVAGLRQVALDVTPHRYEGMCPDRVDGPDLRDPDCPACSLLD